MNMMSRRKVQLKFTEKKLISRKTNVRCVVKTLGPLIVIIKLSSELNEILNSECRPLCEAFDRGYWGKRIKV